MPLYTYIASYKGRTYVDQEQRSNPKSFVAMMLGRATEDMLPGLTKPLRDELVDKVLRSGWSPVPNRLNVWRTAFILGGSEFELYAIQTER